MALAAVVVGGVGEAAVAPARSPTVAHDETVRGVSHQADRVSAALGVRPIHFQLAARARRPVPGTVHHHARQNRTLVGEPAARLGEDGSVAVVITMDDYYADRMGPGGRRVATLRSLPDGEIESEQRDDMEVARQLAKPLPDDLSSIDLATYRKLDRRWQNWQTVADWCRRIAVGVLDRLAEPPRGTP